MTPCNRTAALVLLLPLLVIGTGCGERSSNGSPGNNSSSAPRLDAFALMEGERIYQAECAGCHGAQLQGQPDWRTRRPDGRLPAPPHDASGHTWHHPLEQLTAIVKNGMVPPNAPEGYVSDMPAYAGKLTDRQIAHVLAWIESQWPEDIRQQRAERFARP